MGRAAGTKLLDIRLDGKKLNQRNSFVYLGGAVCGDGGTGTAAPGRRHGDGGTGTAARGRRHGDGNSQDNTSWSECMEESGRGDGR